MAKSNRRGQALVLTTYQLKEVFRSLPSRHDAIAQLAYYTASRISEILSLRVDQLNRPDGLVITQHKTDRTKEVPWSKEIKEVVEGIALPASGYAFATRGHRGYMSTQGFEKQLNPVFASLDIVGASTHSFRRSMATHLYKAGVDLESIRRRTGHTDIPSLCRYIDVGAEEAHEKYEAALDKFWR